MTEMRSDDVTSRQCELGEHHSYTCTPSVPACVWEGAVADAVADTAAAVAVPIAVAAGSYVFRL